MIHALHTPRPPLDRFIEFLWSSERYIAQTARERILPTGALAVVIHLAPGPMCAFADARALEPVVYADSVVCGARASPLIIGAAFGRTVGIHFRPGGARRFFDVPTAALAEQVVSLDALWGRSVEDLRARLIEATDAERMRILEAFLLERARTFDVAGTLREALAAFEDPSLSSVSEVNRRTGLSPKRLLALFREEVGLGPKEYWRVRRFRAALSVLERGTMRTAAVATEHGYFDQAHFLRECRALTGMTPTTYLAARRPAKQAIASR